MVLPAGTRLGPYEILSALGAGGMGEVYRARDTRLGRTVAIKILPSLDAELKARFAREARTIALLTHPHICTLYDVGQQDATDYLVMEHLDGQTLAARLERGPLEFDDVVRYGIQIANALDKAHRAGVVHRDLKPANIMLTSGGAKLLDFGVAKLRFPTPVAGMATMTEATPLTGHGTLVGTPRYMAPEQLEGREADTRSDLFALGAILYEMVTGRKAFQGNSAASVIAAVMSSEPPLAELEKLSPPGFDHLVKTCLIKNPDDRCQSAHDVVLRLQWIADYPRRANVPPRRGQSRWKWIAVAAFLAAVAALAGNLARRSQAPPPLRVSILPPDNEVPLAVPALSPDGTRVAFSARGPSGPPLLWIRSLASSAAVPLAGTEGALDPFWSPDGRFIGFFANGKLKIVGADVKTAPLPVQTLADAPVPRGGAWSADGVIVFARNIEDGLYRVSASGGDVTPETRLDRTRRENSHRWPQFLPDGRRLLFLARGVPEHQGIYVGTSGSNDWKLVLRTPLNALAVVGRSPVGGLFGAGTGHLLFMHERTLMAQPFDVDRVALGGDPSPLADRVGTVNNRGMFSVGGNTALAYRTVTEDARYGWLDRSGKVLASVDTAGFGSRASPDGKHMVFTRVDQQTGAGDLWVADVARGIPRLLTSHPSYEWMPVWSPDGSTIAFSSNRDGPMDLYEKAVFGSEPEKPLLKSDKRKTPTHWSRTEHGEFLLYQEEDPTNGWDLWALPTTGGLKPFPIVRSRFNEQDGVLSPDGRWLAYTSDETGTDQIYVRTFPGSASAGSGSGNRDEPWIVSADAGVQPRWRGDGKELFYYSRDRGLMSVSIADAASFEPSVAAPLFAPVIHGDPWYDVTADGKRFLTVAPGERRDQPLELFLNWAETLKK